MTTCQDVSDNWSVPCVEYNKGLRVGGPFHGSEHSVLFFPGDYPEGYELSRERLEVNHVFCGRFPEGAVYHWHEDRREWHYIGQMSQDSQDGAEKLLGIFGVERNPPL